MKKFLSILKLAVAAGGAGLAFYVANGGTEGVALAAAVLAGLREFDKSLES